MSSPLHHRHHLLLLLLTLLSFSTATATHRYHYFKTIRHNASSQYLELTKPLQTPPPFPNCSLLLQHNFSNTYGSPPASSLYSPPSDCPSPWSQIILEIHITIHGEQYDRIVGIWLDGAELIRTSTAEPSESGIFWNVRKDVTRYSSLLQKSNLTLTVMLENIVNDVFTGVYHVNVSLLYYNENNKTPVIKPPSVITDENLGLGLEFQSQFGNELPADLIIPVSSDGKQGFWFRIENELDVHSKEILIPGNAYKAVLEIYVSFHGNDEFWYSNPPDSYIKLNNLSTERGNGAFREVFVTIDGVYVGSVVPFPVIFTGGINPLFWEPVVAIGAFDLPSYNLDLSPFLGMLLDGKQHVFGIGVRDSISYWYVDANLHLWLDPNLEYVTAKNVLYRNSDFSVKRKSKFEKLDGLFKIKVERTFEFSGWVNSSKGNLTSYVSNEYKVKNSIEFKNDGQFKEVKQKIKSKTEVKVESDAGIVVTGAKRKSKYPLTVITSTLPGSVNNTSLLITNVSHSRNEKVSQYILGGVFSSSISNSQVSGGWMEVQDHSVLSGMADTNQTLSYTDGFNCYSRTVYASNGTLLEDKTTLTCTASS